MATTAVGAALSETQFRQQLVVRAALIAQIRRVWPALVLANLAQTWPIVEAAVLAFVIQRRRDSAGLAAGYYAAFRRAEGIPGSASVVLDDFGAEDIRRASQALQFSRNRLISAIELKAAQPLQNAFVNVTGTATRLALEGGRETIRRTVDADRRALGWARRTSGRACFFCAMLASRGPVYKEGSGRFRAHDHCACSLEPVYRREQEWPAHSRDWQAQWREVTQGTKGDESIKAFRRAFEAA